MAVKTPFGPKHFGAFALAGALALFGLIPMAQSMRTLAWPSTTGKITAASMDRTQSRRDGVFTKKFKVKYRYSVDGRSYESKRYMYGSPFMNPLLTSYRPGTEVDVYYNANDPSVAVLARGIPGTSFLIFVSALLPIVVVTKPGFVGGILRALGRR